MLHLYIIHILYTSRLSNCLIRIIEIYDFDLRTILVDGVSTANHSGAYDYCFMSFGLGRSVVFGLPCYSTREKCSTLLSTFDGMIFFRVDAFVNVNTRNCC